MRERWRAAEARHADRAKAERAGLTRVRQVRLLAGWLAASIALHVLMLLALPDELVRHAPRVEILHVELDRQEPAREEPQARANPSPARERAEHSRARPRGERAASAQPPPQSRNKAVLAQPQPPKLQSEPPAPQPMPREAAVPPQRSTAPGFALAAPDIEAPARESPVAPPPAAPSAEPRVQALEPPAAPRISDAKALSAQVRYPRSAEQGRVTLKVLVDREGRVAKAALERTSGYPALDRHALQAVRSWRFAPARRGTEAVEQWLVVNVDY